MPSPRQIAKFWSMRDEFSVDPLTPECFGCRRAADDWRSFDRAHLVDRQVGGLDHEGNLVMLCPRPCHSLMPVFDIDERETAICWVRDQGWLHDLVDRSVSPDVGELDYRIATWLIAEGVMSSQRSALPVRALAVC